MSYRNTFRVTIEDTEDGRLRARFYREKAGLYEEFFDALTRVFMEEARKSGKKTRVEWSTDLEEHL